MVGNQRQIDGDHPCFATQRLGQFGRQCPIQAPFQFGHLGQAGRQRLANCLIRRRVGQIAAGGKDRNHPRRGNQQHLQQRAGSAFGSLVLQPQRRRQPGIGIAVNFILRNDIIPS